jgi:hypothetical protein
MEDGHASTTAGRPSNSGQRSGWQAAGVAYGALGPAYRCGGAAMGGRLVPGRPSMPSNNEIWSARVAHVAQTAPQFGTATGPVKTEIAKIQSRKRDIIGREVAFHLNAAILPSLCLQRGAAATALVRLQSGQLPARPGFARRGEAIITDHPAQPADENRREGRPPRTLGHLPDDRGRRAACIVADHPPGYCGCAAVAAGPMFRIAASGGRTSISGTPVPKSWPADRKARLFGLRCTAKERPMCCHRGDPCRKAWPKTALSALDSEIDGCLGKPGSPTLSSTTDLRQARTRKAERAMNHPILPSWPAQSALGGPQLHTRTSEDPLGKIAWSRLRQRLEHFTWFIVRRQMVAEWG